MKVEVRSDNSTRITGYVNVVERMSRPVITPRGRVIEVVEQGVFRDALERATEIRALVDHNQGRMVATTANSTLTLGEDNIGLRAELETTDAEVAKAGREGRIRGWSFGMKNVVDALEERSEGLPIRHIKKIDLDHVTLSIHSTPFYGATSVEVRAGEEEEMEYRAFMDGKVEVAAQEEKKKVNYADFENRLAKLKGE